MNDSYRNHPCEYQIGFDTCGRPSVTRAKTLTKIRYFCENHIKAANQIQAQRRLAAAAAKEKKENNNNN